MAKPPIEAIPTFFHRYVNLVQEDDVSSALQNNTGMLFSFLEKIPEEKWSHRYAEGKWSIREMVQHLIDAERIFSYRALCISRGEKQSLPGFDENDYTAASEANRRSKEELLSEYGSVRDATEKLFASFSEEQRHKTGISNNNSITVDAIGFLTVGHTKHHLNILQERYL